MASSWCYACSSGPGCKGQHRKDVKRWKAEFLEYAKAKRMPHVMRPKKFLGHGSFGAVFSTGKRGVVLKLTTDRGEVTTVERIMKHPDLLVGFVKPYKWLKIKPKLYAIWREAADPDWKKLVPRAKEFIFDADDLVGIDIAEGVLTMDALWRKITKHCLWDLHEGNLGLVTRNKKKSIVVIDYGV